MELDTITCADVMDYLRSLPDDSVDCCITSPPYMGLRDYGTATWEGGDPECAHSGLAETQLRPGASSQTPVSQSHSMRARQSSDHLNCVRCSATRIDKQIGLEPTPAGYVAKMVEVFREVWRVLKPTGTCWLNIGDSYAGYWGDGKARQGGRRSSADTNGWTRGFNMNARPSFHEAFDGTNLKPKDRMLMPARVAIALQDAGWWIRSEIVWSKPNCMPSSAEDRPTDSHEMIYMLTKAARYWSDFTAIREAAKEESAERLLRGVSSANRLLHGAGGQRPHSIHQPRPNGKQAALGKRQYTGFNDRWDDRAELLLTRNVRSVWTIAPEPSNYDYCGRCDLLFMGATRKDVLHRTVDGVKKKFCPKCNQDDGWVDHFAAYPHKLVERCILAGCPAQVCSACDKPWERVIEKEFVPQTDVSLARGMKNAEGLKPMDASNGWVDTPRGTTTIHTLGWQPTCKCGAGVDAGVVLDPFLGSGTTALVARKLGRHYLGCDLSEAYVRLANARLGQAYTLPLFMDL